MINLRDLLTIACPYYTREKRRENVLATQQTQRSSSSHQHDQQPGSATGSLRPQSGRPKSPSNSSPTTCAALLGDAAQTSVPKYAATYAPGYGALLYGDADGGVGGIFKRRDDKAVVRPRFDDDAPVDTRADDPAAIDT